MLLFKYTKEPGEISYNACFRSIDQPNLPEARDSDVEYVLLDEVLHVHL